MSGWKCDNLHITVRQRLCEVLYVAGRRKDAEESLLEMANSFDEEVYMSEVVTKWVSGESILYPLVFHVFKTSLQTLPTSVSPLQKVMATRSRTTEDGNVVTVHAAPTPLLRAWAKAKLAHYSWKDAVLSAVHVSITFCSRVYSWP